MKRLLLAGLVVGVILAPATAPAQMLGEMLFEQGCDAFELVEDLGTSTTPIGQVGRWLMRDLNDGSEFVYAFEAVDLVPPPFGDPFKFGGITFVAWQFEGTGTRGTNRTSFEGTVDPDFNFTVFFEGETFRGNRYKSGGISGTASGVFGGGFAYDEVKIVLCKAGLGGK